MVARHWGVGKLIIYKAQAHKHDKDITYEAKFKLAALKPKGCPIQKVIPIDDWNEFSRLEDCSYTYISLPSCNRLAWEAENAEEASQKLRDMNLECFITSDWST